MKKSDFLSLGIILSIFTLSWLNIFLGYFTQYTLVIFIIIMILFSYKLIGCQKHKSVIEKDVILAMLAYMILYYLIIYVIGFFTGFTKNIYSLKLINVLKNISPVILTILTGEILRYIINSRAKTSKFLIALSFLAFTLMYNTINVRALVASDDVALFTIIEQLGLFIIPSVTTNILLTYLSISVGFKSAIVYRLLMELPIYLIPIFPKFGNYIESVIRVTLPVLVFIFVYRAVHKNKVKSIVIIEKKKLVNLFRINVLLFSAILVYFVCGFFRYQALVIATGSMTPNINVGDVVIVDRLKRDSIKKLKVGDVVAYRKEKVVICHRIINIVKTDDMIYFETQGDANSTPDQLLVEETDIVGIVKTKINYIGYPTVMLNEIMK